MHFILWFGLKFNLFYGTLKAESSMSNYKHGFTFWEICFMFKWRMLKGPGLNPIKAKTRKIFCFLLIFSVFRKFLPIKICWQNFWKNRKILGVMKRAACCWLRKRQPSTSTVNDCPFLLVDVDHPALFYWSTSTTALFYWWTPLFMTNCKIKPWS